MGGKKEGFHAGMGVPPNKLDRSNSNFFPNLEKGYLWPTEKHFWPGGHLHLRIVMSFVWQAKHCESAKQKLCLVVSNRFGPGFL